MIRIFCLFGTHTQLFNGLLSGTTRVGRYQKKHSPTHTHPDHRTSFITFLHLQRSMIVWKRLLKQIVDSVLVLSQNCVTNDQPGLRICKPVLLGACPKPGLIGRVAAERAFVIIVAGWCILVVATEFVICVQNVCIFCIFWGTGSPGWVAARQIVSASASVIFPCTIKSRSWWAGCRIYLILRRLSLCVCVCV